jgi:hypothetical protein
MDASQNANELPYNPYHMCILFPLFRNLLVKPAPGTRPFIPAGLAAIIIPLALTWRRELAPDFDATRHPRPDVTTRRGLPAAGGDLQFGLRCGAGVLPALFLPRRGTACWARLVGVGLSGLTGTDLGTRLAAFRRDDTSNLHGRRWPLGHRTLCPLCWNPPFRLTS